MSEQELLVRIESLEGSLTHALGRIREMEESLDAHHGIDFGSDGVDANTPHRNLSVDTIESGGGVIRQDQHGMQVETGASFTTAIFFVRDLTDDPLASTKPRGLISGSVDTNNASVFISAISGSNAPTLTLQSHSSDGTSNFSLFSNAALLLPSNLADFDSMAQADGAVQYRTDTDKFRGRVNGATENFAMEGYVDAHTGDTSDAHDASAISVLDTGGNFTGTDVEAVLAELFGLIPTGGGGMSLIVKEADESLTTNATEQDDNDLLFSVLANEVWQFEGVLFVTSHNTPDFKMRFAGPAASVGSWGAVLNSGTAIDEATAALGTSVTIAWPGAQTNMIRFWGGIKNGANVGSLKLQWSQGTSDGNATAVLAGSYIKYQLES